MQQAIKVVGASRDLARVAQRVLSPLDEAATLAAALVRLSRPLPTYSSVSRSDGSRVWSLDQGSNLGDCMQVAGEVRGWRHGWAGVARRRGPRHAAARAARVPCKRAPGPARSARHWQQDGVPC